MLTASAAGNPQIVVDLAALEYIDCYSLGALGGVRAQARQAGGDLLLAAPHGLVRRLLDLVSVFAVHASVEEACGAPVRPGGLVGKAAAPPADEPMER